VHRDDSLALGLGVIEEMMASLHPVQHKPLILQNFNDFLGREHWTLRWIVLRRGNAI